MTEPTEKLKNLSAKQRQLLLQKLQQKSQINNKIQTTIQDDHSFPLSSGQQSMWFLQQTNPNSSAYNISAALQLTGPLDISALKKSILTIIQRHQSLRSTFVKREDKIVQCISPVSILTMPIEDISNLNKSDQQITITNRLKAESRYKFDLTKNTLTRCLLLKTNAKHHILAITLHHIISDGWSMGIFIKELELSYTAFINNQEPNLPELPLQYSDFSSWQTSWLQNKNNLDKLYSYWTSKLNDPLPVLALPTYKPRPKKITNKGRKYQFKINKDLTDKTATLFQQNGCTQFMGLLAAFKILLFRYTMSKDIIVGTPTANRNQKNLENVFGYFVNTLALRTLLDPKKSIVASLKEVKATCLDAFSNQNLPFEKLIEKINPKRSQAHHPLFQVMFSFQNEDIPKINLPNLTVEKLNIDPETAMFDLTLEIWPKEDGLHCTIEYSTDLFKHDFIKQMATHYQMLLKSMLDTPKTPISKLEMLTLKEKNQLLHTFNDTKKDYPKNKTIHQLFEAQVTKTPTHTAIVFENQSITYHALNRKANIIANKLRHQGIKPDTIIGILADRSIEMVIGILGILKSGGAYLPINPNDPKKRIEFMLKNSNAKLLLTKNNLIKQAVKLNFNGAKLNIETMLHLPENPFLLSAKNNSPKEHQNPKPVNKSTDLIYIIYTSGSTGKPKGVMIEHKSMTNITFSLKDIIYTDIYPTLTSPLKEATITSFCFDVFAQQLFCAMTLGHQLHIVSNETKMNPEQLIKYLKKEKINFFNVTPSYLHFLANANLNHAELTHLKYLIIGAEELQNKIIKNLSQTKAFSNTKMCNMYGPTECCIDTTHFNITKTKSTQPIPIGKPLPNYTIYILDQYKQLTPVGVPGTIHISGEGLSRGYINNQKQTQTVFFTHPFNKEKIIYNSNDSGLWRSDGNIVFQGRKDNQIKIRGFRVELNEIKTAILKHKDINNCYIEVDNNNTTKRIIAYFTTTNSGINETILTKYLKTILPNYMIPAQLINVDTLPFNNNGKIDTAKLKKSVTQIKTAAPTKTELAVIKIFQNICGNTAIQVDEDFFQYGGNSLLINSLLLKINATFKINLSLNQLFETDFTVKNISNLITNSQTIEIPTINLNDEFNQLSKTLPKKYDAIKQNTINNIFFTGATGELGSAIVCELLANTSATIYCLVRAKSTAEGLEKTITAISKHEQWDPHFKNRLIPVLGDINKAKFGLNKESYNKLSATIDSIFHSAAIVNFSCPYHKLKSSNVLGTLEILKFANNITPKKLFYASTLSIFDSIDYTKDKNISEKTILKPAQSCTYTGYSQSKWVSEKLVNQAITNGLAAKIIRFGRILGKKKNDFLLQILQLITQLKFAPDLDIELDMVPSKQISEIVSGLIKNNHSKSSILHLMSKNYISLKTIVGWINSLGYNIQVIPYPNWKKKMNQLFINTKDPAVTTALSIINQTTDESNLSFIEFYQKKYKQKINNTLTSEHLKMINTDLPEMTKQHFLDYFKNTPS